MALRQDKRQYHVQVDPGPVNVENGHNERTRDRSNESQDGDNDAMPAQQQEQQQTTMTNAMAVVVVSMDQIVDIPAIQHRTSLLRRESFVMQFISSRGPRQILFLVMLVAMGVGSTIGVVPAVMTDRFARLKHGYDDPRDCTDYVNPSDKPLECIAGSADAQAAVAIEQMISHGITFVTSSYVGSLSDEHGRKGILVAGVLLSTLSPLCLVVLQLRPGMSPFWYYAAGASTGLVNWMAIALSALADVMPAEWRAPSFGMLLAGFGMGFALAPLLALYLGHFRVSVLALATLLLGLINTIFFFPETVSSAKASEARQERRKQTQYLSTLRRILWNLHRPLWELSILNRNRIIRLLATLAFFSGLIDAAGRTLLLYYLEVNLGFQDLDVAVLFCIRGFVAIAVQAFLLKILNDSYGERNVVMLCFFLGCVENVMLGTAKTKAVVYVAFSLGALTNMSFPAISALKSNNVNGSEQGRIQGALYSLQALAYATGPVMLEVVYRNTQTGALLGPGTMFVFAAVLYVIPLYCAYLLPPEADSRAKFSTKEDADDESIRSNSPLLDEHRV